MPSSDAIVNPVRGKNSPNLGPVAIMVASQADLNILYSLMNLDKDKSKSLFVSRLYIDNNTENIFSVVGPFMGAPYATMLLETLIAWGAEKIIFFGWCGSISSDVKIGDIIVPASAVIDEGTSKHYQEGDNGMVKPSVYITEKVKEALIKSDLAFHEGVVWSTDAIYRETREKVKYYQDEDVLAVEMEMSALFTVGKFRNVQVGGILAVSDELSTFKWRPGFRNEQFKKSRMTVCEVINDLCNAL